MIKYYGLALGAGLISGFMYVSVAFGGVPAVALNMFSSLPLFLLGLGVGTPAVLTGGLAGLATCLLAGNGFVLSYGLAVAVPAAVLSRQALLARENERGEKEWYPLDRLVLILAALAAVNITLAFIMAAGKDGGLLGEIGTQIRQFFKFAETKGQPAVSDAQREQAILAMSRLMLMGVTLVWMLSLVINGALAQEILRRFGKNIRPKADIVDLRLPKWVSAAFALSIAGTFLSPPFDNIALAAVGLGFAAFFLQGLAVLHALFRKWRTPDLLLVGVYILILIISWLIALIVIIGIMESWLELRRRISPSGSNSGNNDQEEE